MTIKSTHKIATTQPTTQNNLKKLSWGDIIIGKKYTTTTTTTTLPAPHRNDYILSHFQVT